MAMMAVCDGCGSKDESGGGFQKRGVVIKKDYCSDCVQVIDDYMKARDELHSDLIVRWDAGLAKLKKDFGGMALPDE